MLERGAFKGLDACLMAHPGPVDILYRNPLGAGRLEIAFHGKAAHASASPWEGNECDLDHSKLTIVLIDAVHV